MAINFYDTSVSGNIPFIDITYGGVIGGPGPTTYYPFASNIPSVRTMKVLDYGSRVIDFGFVHLGINTPMCAYPKDPDSQMDFGVDWTGWLQAGEAIDTVEWTLDYDSMTIITEDTSGNTEAVLLSGGLPQKVYTLTCRITTNQDRIEDRSMFIRCANT